MKPSPSKKNIKELFMAEDENKPEEPLKQAAMASLNTHGGAWSNRQGQWPLNERKMIFSCKKEIVTQQWLDNLRAVVMDSNGNGDFQEGSQDNILNEINGDGHGG